MAISNPRFTPIAPLVANALAGAVARQAVPNPRFTPVAPNAGPGGLPFPDPTAARFPDPPRHPLAPGGMALGGEGPAGMGNPGYLERRFGVVVPERGSARPAPPPVVTPHPYAL